LPTTRQGCRSILDLSLLVFIVVCGSLSLLTYSGAFSPGCGAPGSGDCFQSKSSRAPAWTAGSQGRSRDLPGANNDVDDSDDDDDDDRGAVAGGAINLIADHGPARLVLERPFDAPFSLRSGGWSLRGPPHVDLDEPTCSLDRHVPDQISRPRAWTAAEPCRQPQNSSHDTRDDVEDRDVDDRDDDGNDESAGALTAGSINLTADHADGRRVIEANSGARSLVGCEAHSLRGPPPSRGCPDSSPSLDHDIPAHTSPFFFASDSHRLRAPPRSIPTPDQTSRNPIATETRSQL